MDHYEQKIVDIIDSHADEIKAFGRDIWTHAELGYKEVRTAGKFASHLRSLGIEPEEGLAITGVKGYLKDKGTEGPVVAVIGEMDALPIADNADANPETGASHCCGHNAQITAVMGAAFALTDPEIKKQLAGNIAFMGVPAEEFVEIGFKKELIDAGKISYGGGKCELIRIGAFDDIDIAVGHHAITTQTAIVANSSSNAFVNKVVTFHGRASHAAGSPEAGVDAQAAVNIAQFAVDAQRETFRDEDTVRVHSFVSKGASAVNVIADSMTMEYSVRAKTIPGFVDANKKVERAIEAACVATGCGVDIDTMPGYMPTQPLKDTTLLREAIDDVCAGKYETGEVTKHGTGSTDFGDVSCIMPLLQFNTGGYSGALHNSNVAVVDEELAYVVPAKIFALTAYKLLKNGGDAAKATLETYEQLMTKEEYVKFWDGMKSKRTIPMNPLPVLQDED